MPLHNEDIAEVFDEIGDLLEIEGDNPFRIRAYRNGARALRELGQDIGTLIEHGEDLTHLPGIGTSRVERSCSPSSRVTRMARSSRRLQSGPSIRRTSSPSSQHGA